VEERLKLLIAEILDLPVDDIAADMNRQRTPEWDSLNHLRLITACESEFDIALTMDEIAAIHTPQHLEMIIDSRSIGRG